MLTSVRTYDENWGEELNSWLLSNSRSKNTWIKWIEGLDPMTTNLNTTDFAVSHGGMVHGARHPMREITITFGVEVRRVYAVGSVPARRTELYNDFAIGEQVWLEFVRNVPNGPDTLRINGWVKDIISPMFVKEPAVQVVILCPDPFFYSEPTVIEKTGGDSGYWSVSRAASRGGAMLIEVSVRSSISTNNFRLGGSDRAMIFDRTRAPISGSLQAGDKIIVNTKPGARKAVMVRGSNPEWPLYNTMDLRASENQWPILVPGTLTNRIRFGSTAAPAGSYSLVDIKVTYQEAHMGL